MLKEFLKTLVEKNAIGKLTDSMLGRVAMRKLVSLGSRELGIPLALDPDDASPEYWILTAGEAGADLQLRCRLHKETLQELLNTAATAWLEKRKVPGEEILAFLVKHMNTTGGA